MSHVSWCISSRPARGAWIEMLHARAAHHEHARRAPHGARGLKFFDKDGPSPKASRAPHGARGLKSVWKCLWNAGAMSRPAWGAWIEIPSEPNSPKAERRSHPSRSAWIEMPGFPPPLWRATSRAPHGARGLKYGENQTVCVYAPRRTPRGVRGLKSQV